MYDMRNPYGARGGYVRDTRGGIYDRGDMRRGMDYNDMDYAGRDYAMYDQRGDYGYSDMARYDRYGSDVLDDHTLEMWSRELTQEIDPMHQQKFKMDTIVKKAEDMGIRFDKFSPMEYYATVIMLVSDFGKTLGMNNVDTYARLAKDWLCDPDAGVKYGKKLSAYYHHIANV